MSDELFLTTFLLLIDGNTAVYFGFFEIQYILQEVLSKSKDESVTYDISRITRKTLLDYTNLFSPNDHKKIDKIIYKYFKCKYDNSWL